MIYEVNKFGEISSVNDFFDFKLSIKMLIFLFIVWCICMVIIVVFMFGGVNNTIDYITTIADETKQKIIETKNTNTNTNNKKKNTGNAEKEE